MTQNNDIVKIDITRLTTLICYRIYSSYLFSSQTTKTKLKTDQKINTQKL